MRARECEVGEGETLRELEERGRGDGGRKGLGERLGRLGGREW